MGDMEKDEFIRKLEEAIQEAVRVLEESRDAQETTRFEEAAEAWRVASETWLLAAQRMPPEKARAVMGDLALGGQLSKWREQHEPGPPPSVLTLYKRPKT